MVSGHSQADESLLTGESLPVDKEPGDAGDRRIDQRRRPVAGRGHGGRRRDRAGAHHRAGANRPRPRNRGCSAWSIESARSSCRRSSRSLSLTLAGWCAGRRRNRDRGDQCRVRPGDRLPLRARPGDADGADDRARAWRPGSGILIKDAEALEQARNHRHGGVRQDRDADSRSSAIAGESEILPESGFGPEPWGAVGWLVAGAQQGSEHPLGSRHRAARAAAEGLDLPAVSAVFEALAGPRPASAEVDGRALLAIGNRRLMIGAGRGDGGAWRLGPKGSEDVAVRRSSGLRCQAGTRSPKTCPVAGGPWRSATRSETAVPRRRWRACIGRRYAHGHRLRRQPASRRSGGRPASAIDRGSCRGLACRQG